MLAAYFVKYYIIVCHFAVPRWLCNILQVVVLFLLVVCVACCNGVHIVSVVFAVYDAPLRALYAFAASTSST